MNGRLFYDPTSERFVIDGQELHCGDVIQVMIGQTWVETRIELDANDEWYLVGLKGIQIDGLPART